MKRIVLYVFFIALLSGCKNESKSIATDQDDKSDDIITLTGDFIYYADAAVLQTNNEIYGVVIDEKMHELDSTVNMYKTDETDMVSVTIKAKKFKKPENEEGWPYKLEIKEIIKVVKPNQNKKNVIKIGK